jgi:hypothetical protein
MKPYTEDHLSDYTYLRTFLSDTPEEELKWHWDEEDRIIKPIEKTDWLFQFDNKLPQNIDTEIYIKKGIYHRLIKGSGDLKIKVTKIF